MRRALAMLVVCAACGRIAPDEDASANDASDGDIAVDALQDAPVDATCPKASTPGASCGLQGLQCEYGTYFDLICDDVMFCENGKFVDNPPPPDCAAKYEIDAGCPSEPIEAGTACTADRAVCESPGRHCVCSDNNCKVLGLGWVCIGSPSNCPIDRPRLGTACANKGQTCAYGDNCCGGFGSVFCTNGVWQMVPPHTCQ